MFLEERNNDLENIPEEAPTEEAPVEEAASEEAPAEEAPVEEAASEESHGKDDPKFNFIIGQKVGMTRLFDDLGTNLPVTIIKAGPCPITQIKSIKNDGYEALQIGFLDNKKISKPIKGHLKKANVVNGVKVLKEFRCNNIDSNFLGKSITLSSFSEGENVNVTSKSKGKGFAGHMKRHNFSGGRASHGKNSVMRKAGSVGAGTWPGRVWKGTRMAGRMGGDNVSAINLKILKIDLEKNLLFVKGAIPGASKSIVYIEKY